MVDVARKNFSLGPYGAIQLGSVASAVMAWLGLAWLGIHIFQHGRSFHNKLCWFFKAARLDARYQRASIDLQIVLLQNESGASKHGLYPTSKWCSDFIYLPLRRRSFGKFDPYTPTFRGRLDCETISHPVNVPLSYSFVQLKIKATEQACQRNIELRITEATNHQQRIYVR